MDHTDVLRDLLTAVANLPKTEVAVVRAVLEKLSSERKVRNSFEPVTLELSGEVTLVLRFRKEAGESTV